MRRPAAELAAQAERAAKLETPRKPDKPAPWMPAVVGTMNWLLLDDLSVLALAEGIVLLRVQSQARQCARTIDVDEDDRTRR